MPEEEKMVQRKTTTDGWLFLVLFALKEISGGARSFIGSGVEEVRRKIKEHNINQPVEFVASNLNRLFDCNLAVRSEGPLAGLYDLSPTGKFLAEGLSKLTPEVLWDKPFREKAAYGPIIIKIALENPDSLAYTAEELFNFTGISESSVRTFCKILEDKGQVEKGKVGKGVGGRMVDQFQLINRTVVLPVPAPVVPAAPAPVVPAPMTPAVLAVPIAEVQKLIPGTPFQMTFPEGSTGCNLAPDTLWGDSSEELVDIAAINAKLDQDQEVGAVEEDEDPGIVVLHLTGVLLEQLQAIATLSGISKQEVLIKLLENLIFQTRSAIASDLTP